ncbi:hypothetical protein LJB89_04420 [Tyzzerella sp. OttesenSCG-928-J15]|nr:hypothetical protein [Tyzzerella sp. OttesenSCG-928-J15]
MITAILTGMMSMTALAHGGHGQGGHRGRHNQTQQFQKGYEPCTVNGCEIVHSHQHNNKWYCGQKGLSGDYEICTVADCDAIGIHEHDGEYYHCQNATTEGRGVNCRRY